MQACTGLQLAFRMCNAHYSEADAMSGRGIANIWNPHPVQSDLTVSNVSPFTGCNLTVSNSPPFAGCSLTVSNSPPFAGCIGADRHVRVYGEALCQPVSGCPSGLCGLRRRGSADRACQVEQSLLFAASNVVMLHVHDAGVCNSLMPLFRSVEHLGAMQPH